MQDAVDIYCFSGTGNTLLAVRALAGELTTAGRSVRILPLERSDPSTVDTRRALGLATAVACQSTYPFVWDFVEALPKATGTEVFFLDTMAMYSGGILGPMRRILEAKGYRPTGAREIVMPSNFLLRKMDPQANRDKTHAALEQARQYARDLLQGSARWRNNTPWQKLLCWFSRTSLPWTLIRKHAHPRVNPGVCTRCGLCAKLCPVENILVENNEPPRFADRCVGCMRCFSFCPVGAIGVGKKEYHPYRAEGITAVDLLGGSESGEQIEG